MMVTSSDLPSSRTCGIGRSISWPKKSPISVPVKLSMAMMGCARSVADDSRFSFSSSFFRVSVRRLRWLMSGLVGNCRRFRLQAW